MTLGLSVGTFTSIHVVLSLVGIASGFIVLLGLLAGKDRAGWTAVFLGSTLLTSASGFGFTSEHLLPSHVVGALSIVVLALAMLARYRFHLDGGWRRTYVICAV